MLHVGNVSFEASFATLEITFDAGDPGPRSSIVLLDADSTIGRLSDFGRLNSFGLHVQEWVGELVGLCGILSVYSVLQASILDTRLMVRLVVFIKKNGCVHGVFLFHAKKPTNDWVADHRLPTEIGQAKATEIGASADRHVHLPMTEHPPAINVYER
jgi:hypothetical protein